MTEDPFNTPEWLGYAKDAMENLVPMMADSAVTVSLVPEGETDIKFALELGLSIMLDKPIIAVVEPGTKVPAQLAKVADAIVEGAWDSPEQMQQRISAELKRVIGLEGS